MRGHLVRTKLLCTNVPAAPGNFAANPPAPNPALTVRDRYAAHAKDGACAACHKPIDPIGMGFEAYDTVGAFMTMESSSPKPTKAPPSVRGVRRWLRRLRRRKDLWRHLDGTARRRPGIFGVTKDGALRGWCDTVSDVIRIDENNVARYNQWLVIPPDISKCDTSSQDVHKCVASQTSWFGLSSGIVQFAATMYSTNAPSYACVLVAAGTVSCWGINHVGQIGQGYADAKLGNEYQKPIQTPAVVPGVSNAVELAVGASHACARTKDNKVRCWGENYPTFPSSRLGDPNMKNGDSPRVPLSFVVGK
jgi:hypothetical protein